MKFVMKFFVVVVLVVILVIVSVEICVLIVVISYEQMGDIDERIGFWLVEMIYFYYELIEVGIDVEFVSINGGVVFIDL